MAVRGNVRLHGHVLIISIFLASSNLPIGFNTLSWLYCIIFIANHSLNHDNTCKIRRARDECILFSICASLKQAFIYLVWPIELLYYSILHAWSDRFRMICCCIFVFMYKTCVWWITHPCICMLPLRGLLSEFDCIYG